ncbi:toprim domain-containing protein [Granulosicoccus sp. 3-233]
MSRGSRVPAQDAFQNRYSHDNFTTTKHDRFIQWADDNGVVAPVLIPYEWVRTNAPQKSYKNKSLGVLLKDNCILAKDFTSDALYLFQDQHQTLGNAKSADRSKLAAKQFAEQAKRIRREKATAASAETIFTESVNRAPFGYMLDKGLKSTHGIRWHEGLDCWIAPITDVHGKLWSYQRIYNRPSGKKLFAKGGRISGCMFLIGKLDESTRLILVCEGGATGASLAEETNHVTACALNAGNLQPVCEAIKVAYPDIEIIVCGDDDRRAEVNTGRQKAIAAASSVNSKVAFPTFCEGCSRQCSDFNDVIQCNSREKSR